MARVVNRQEVWTRSCCAHVTPNNFFRALQLQVLLTAARHPATGRSSTQKTLFYHNEKINIR